MLFASAIVTDDPIDRAVMTLASEITRELEGSSVDLLLAFFSPHFTTQAEELRARLGEALGPAVLLGCSGQGVIGREHEVESRQAIAVVAAHLPDVLLSPFVLRADRWREIFTDAGAFAETVGPAVEAKLFLLLADPLSTPVDPLLDLFNDRFRGVPVVGGMASGAGFSEGNALLAPNEVLAGGAVGVSLSGPLAVDVIVSQGCRPIGSVMTVTEAEETVLHTLDGKPALAAVQSLVEGLPQEDRDLLRHGLFIGRSIAAEKTSPGRGDFLIRSVVGVDQARGTIGVGDLIESGERVQFHVRDGATAREDLEMMLSLQPLFGRPRGAFLFSCNGRGTHLYGHPDGDISVIQDYLGGIPAAGFFCAGEIGPIGGRNFLHGHTASLALLRSGEERSESTGGVEKRRGS